MSYIWHACPQSSLLTPRFDWGRAPFLAPTRLGTRPIASNSEPASMAFRLVWGSAPFLEPVRLGTRPIPRNSEPATMATLTTRVDDPQHIQFVCLPLDGPFLPFDLRSLGSLVDYIW